MTINLLTNMFHNPNVHILLSFDIFFIIVMTAIFVYNSYMTIASCYDRVALVLN